PDEPATGYFHEVQETGSTEADRGLAIILTWSSLETGVASWPVSGALARSLLPDPLPATARFFATPQVASPAERWLGQAVSVQTQTEHLMQAHRSLWNLLQFDLTPQSKGLSMLSDRLHQFMGPQWRAARMGLVALLVIQVLGLNLWAWRQDATVEQKKADMTRLLKEAHPQVQVVRDPPRQMQMETDALRSASGQVGERDMEGLMALVASAWPVDQPSELLQYDGSSLTVTPPRNWGDAERAQFIDKLRAAGAQVEWAEGRLTVRRGA